jgi:ABC-type transport system involved in cytochrome c biogenesis permease subunit
MLSLLFAYASFALAGVLGLTYVLQFKEIKKKNLGFFYTRLPSLQVLDTMNSRAVAVGWTFLTLGVIVGVIWATQAQAALPADPRAQAFSIQDPKILVTVVTWVVYSFAIVARQVMGWSGRRAAWLSALGFAIVLLSFLPINYFVTTSHSFN